jgi:HEPN domain-containing protein
MDFEPEFQNLREECGLLNEYITEARYPGDLPFESISEDDARQAIEAASKVEEFVLKEIDLSKEAA